MSSEESSPSRARHANRTYVALVTGPLQTISAVEGLHVLGATGHAFYYSEDPPMPELESLCSRARVPLHWIQRHRLPARFVGLLRAMVRLLFARRLMLGSLHQRPFLVAALLARHQLVMLDDGAGTEEIAAHRRGGLGSKTVLRRLAERRPFLWFSIYSPQLIQGDSMVENRLEHVRSLYSGETSLIDEAWVVGAPFIDRGMMPYRQYIESIRRFLVPATQANLDVRYIPHPRESDESAQSVCSELGLDLVRLSAPIELEVLRRRQLPRMVFSVASSVFDTLPLLEADFPSGFQLWTTRFQSDLLRGLPEALLQRIAVIEQRLDLRVA